MFEFLSATLKVDTTVQVLVNTHFQFSFLSCSVSISQHFDESNVDEPETLSSNTKCVIHTVG